MSLGFLLRKCLWSESCPATFDITSYLHQTSGNNSMVRKHYLADQRCCAPLHVPIWSAGKVHWHSLETPGFLSTCRSPYLGHDQHAVHLSFNARCCLGSAPLPFPWVSRCWNDNCGHSECTCPACSPPHRPNGWTVADWLEERSRCWRAAEPMSAAVTIPISWVNPLSPAAHLPRGCPCGWGHRHISVQPSEHSTSREVFASFASGPVLSLNQAEEHLCNPAVSSCTLQSRSDCLNWQD